MLSSIIFSVLVFSSYCLLLSGSIKAENAEDELIAVTVLYRHGDRTIAHSYPRDPYKEEGFWPVPYGELTNMGKKQHYALGKWLRQRYDQFLSSKYLAKEFRIQSSNYDRCLMSAAANLAGLFPPEQDQMWNPALYWQPIPIHTLPNNMDGMLALEKLCPEYARLSEELRNTKYYQDLDKSNEKLYAYLMEKTGMRTVGMLDVYELYDTLLIESYFNFTLPIWTDEVFPEKLKPLAFATFEFETHTPEIAKFRVGQVFDKVLEQFESFVSKGGDATSNGLPKFQVFSAHDTNVFNVLNALRIPDLELVPYTGMVIFELKRRENGEYYVLFGYKRSKDAELLTIKGCEADCDYRVFKKILQPLSLNEAEWDEACYGKLSK